MDTVIEVNNLSKKYRYGELQSYYTLQDILIDLARRPLKHFIRGNNSAVLKKGEFWALRNVSFKVNRGEVVGVIGQNGAGKSTILKILSRITPPTSGKVTLKGRVGSLLEVGTGFHQELTGRENIYLNGAILGMSRREINRKFDEIVDFSGIETFLNTPVKHYSSGMYMRLAFAVAAHLDSEILLVDEVLAVGDSEFQKKCLRKMDSISNKEGRTIIFVSHNMMAIEQLCDKCILLRKGKIQEIGTPHKIVGNYLSSGIMGNIRPPIGKYRSSDTFNPPVYINGVYVSGFKKRIPKIEMNTKQTIVINITAKKNIAKGNISLALFNSEGVKTDLAFSLDDNFYLDVKKGRHRVEFVQDCSSLPPGKYSISVGLNQSFNTVAWDAVSYYPIFEIENRKSVIYWNSRPWGVHHSRGNVWKIT